MWWPVVMETPFEDTWVFLSTFPRTPKLNKFFFAKEWAHTTLYNHVQHSIPINHLMHEALNTRLWGCSCTWRFGRYETGRIFSQFMARLVFTAFEWTQTELCCCKALPLLHQWCLQLCQQKQLRFRYGRWCLVQVLLIVFSLFWHLGRSS